MNRLLLFALASSSALVFSVSIASTQNTSKARGFDDVKSVWALGLKAATDTFGVGGEPSVPNPRGRGDQSIQGDPSDQSDPSDPGGRGDRGEAIQVALNTTSDQFNVSFLAAEDTGTFNDLQSLANYRIGTSSTDGLSPSEDLLLTDKTSKNIGFTPGSPFTTMSMNGSQNIATPAEIVAASTPAVPEPETYALLLWGMGVLGFIKYRLNPRDLRQCMAQLHSTELTELTGNGASK